MGLMRNGEIERFNEKDSQTENSLILKMSLDGFITFSTQNIKAIIDYKPEELIGSHIGNFIHQKDYAYIMKLCSTNNEEVCSAFHYDCIVKLEAR